MPRPPIVILVRPQLAENIGAAARAMVNFGLKELRLVAPRDGWPSKRARETASGGEAIIDAAKTYPDFASAMADIETAYATTARPRDMIKRVVTPDKAMAEISSLPHRERAGGEGPHPQGEGIKVALVFGPERTGLENEDVVLCDTLITIPTAPEHASLNLAQSVMVLSYEWFKQDSGFRIQDSGKKTIPPPESRILNPEFLATKEEWLGLFTQLEEYLDKSDHFRAGHKKAVMWQNLQNMLLRARWSSQEVRTFRGVLRSIWQRRIGEKPRRKIG